MVTRPIRKAATTSISGPTMTPIGVVTEATSATPPILSTGSGSPPSRPTRIRLPKVWTAASGYA